MATPTIDLTGNSLETPKQQLQDIIDNASPIQAREIKSMLSGNKSFAELIKDYGTPDGQDIDNSLTSTQFDNIYRDVYRPTTYDPADNRFQLLTDLYSRLTGKAVDVVPPRTMESLYEIIYGTFMNYSDYEEYTRTGDPYYFYTHDSTQLANTVFNGASSGNFNELKVPVEVLQQLTVDNRYYDKDYIYDLGGHDTQVLNPFVGKDSARAAYDEITQLLQIPLGATIPAEAATFFSDIDIDSKGDVYYPTKKWRRFAHSKKYSVKLSHLAQYVLYHIIMRTDLTYDELSSNSIISIIASTGLNSHHSCIYLLIKKTLLELYSLCYIVHDEERVAQYLQQGDLSKLRHNLRYLKYWCAHYGVYRKLCEVWEDLDEAVGYMQPYLSSFLNSQDVQTHDDTIDYP